VTFDPDQTFNVEFQGSDPKQMKIHKETKLKKRNSAQLARSEGKRGACERAMSGRGGGSKANTRGADLVRDWFDTGKGRDQQPAKKGLGVKEKKKKKH